MKNKESELIEILHRCKNLVVDFEVEEALQHAIKCVELQIPKMPVQWELTPALCPNCKAELSEHRGDGY